VILCAVSKLLQHYHREQTYLPKLFTGILARDSLQDLRATGVLIREFCHVVDGAIDYYILFFRLLVVFGNVGGGKYLGHLGEVRGDWFEANK